MMRTPCSTSSCRAEPGAEVGAEPVRRRLRPRPASIVRGPALRALRTLRAALVAAVAGLAVAGCAGGGGGGGAPASSSAGGVAGGATGGAVADRDPPRVTILAPARGAYLPVGVGVLVEGTADDGVGGSGVASVTVSGTPASVDAAGRWSASVPLVLGLNTFVVRATDRAGHTAKAVASVLSGDYLADGAPVPLAASTRLNEAALGAIAPVIADALHQSGAIQNALFQGPLFQGEVRDPIFHACLASAVVEVLSASYDPPQIAFDAVPGGVLVDIHVRRLRTTLQVRDRCGIPYRVVGDVTADDVEVDLALDLGVDPHAGAFTTAVRGAGVQLHGFGYGIQGIPQAITNIVRAAVEAELESQLSQLLTREVASRLPQALAGLAAPLQRSAGGRTVTFAAEPEALACDDQGIAIGFAALLGASRDPAVPVVPGSLYAAAHAARAPLHAAAPGFYASAHENLIQRALHASWQAGFWNQVIDQQALAQSGMALPFQLNAQMVALFFPPLGALVGATPGGAAAPVAIALRPRMQPVLEVTGGRRIFELGAGEVELDLLLDLGLGYTPVFTASVHLRAGLDLALSQSDLAFSIDGQSVQFEADLLASALPLEPNDVEQFIEAILPPALILTVNGIRPIPVPTFQGLGIAQASTYADGAGLDHVTVSGEVR